MYVLPWIGELSKGVSREFCRWSAGIGSSFSTTFVVGLWFMTTNLQNYCHQPQLLRLVLITNVSMLIL